MVASTLYFANVSEMVNVGVSESRDNCGVMIYTHTFKKIRYAYQVRSYIVHTKQARAIARLLMHKSIGMWVQ